MKLVRIAGSGQQGDTVRKRNGDTVTRGRKSDVGSQMLEVRAKADL